MKSGEDVFGQPTHGRFGQMLSENAGLSREPGPASGSSGTLREALISLLRPAGRVRAAARIKFAVVHHQQVCLIRETGPSREVDFKCH